MTPVKRHSKIIQIRQKNCCATFLSCFFVCFKANSFFFVNRNFVYVFPQEFRTEMISKYQKVYTLNALMRLFQWFRNNLSDCGKKIQVYLQIFNLCCGGIVFYLTLFLFYVRKNKFSSRCNYSGFICRLMSDLFFQLSKTQTKCLLLFVET